MTDFRGDVNPLKSRVLRWLLIVVGSLSLAIGMIGVFLPLLPTTPFLLLTAACYARSSERFYNWLVTNRYFGVYIRLWRDEGKVPRKAKIVAIAMIAITLGSTIVFFIDFLPARLILAAIGLAVIAYLLRLPSK